MAPFEPLLFCNGINGSTGEASTIPLSELWAGLLRMPSPGNREELRRRRQQDESRPEAVARLKAQVEEWQLALASCPPGPVREELALQVARAQAELLRRLDLGVREGIDPLNLAQAGWGILFPNTPSGCIGGLPESAIREALSPLLTRRQAQAGARFRILTGAEGLRPGDKKQEFLLRHGCATSGPVSPERMPYYLLLVGSPQEIPFSFQHQLGVQYAIGRIYFETLLEYENYARGVISAEDAALRRRRISLFGVMTPDDPATEMSQHALIEPLYAALDKSVGTSSGSGSAQGAPAAAPWSVERIDPEAATQATLLEALGGRDAPALLFSASHGLFLPAGHDKQLSRQGAIICRDYPGPWQWQGEIPDRFFVAGEHIPESADVRGMMLFSFSCFSAGTPSADSFPQRGVRRLQSPRSLAAHDFLAALPQRLLGHPRGGALAVIGHIDRAWSYSFRSPGETTPASTETFHSALLRLAHGQPVGYALDLFSQRYAELATELMDQLDRLVDENDPGTAAALCALWTATTDAKSYVILGDPATRLGAAS